VWADDSIREFAAARIAAVNPFASGEPLRGCGD